MTIAKYVQRRVKTDGSVVWAFNPPAYVRETITQHKITYVQFDNRVDAEEHSKLVQDLYLDVKKQEKAEIYLPIGSVMSLAASYKRTNAWSSLAVNTKRTYNQLLQGCFAVRLGQSTKTFGEMNAKNVSPMLAEQVYSYLKENVSEHRANHTIKVLRRVWQVCKRKSLVRHNPFREMGLRQLPERIILWEPEQVQAFIKHADESGYWSIGTMALLCYDLCQRPGDMRQLLWQNYKDGHFDLVQEKTKVRVTIPASPRLIERLSGHSCAPSEAICVSDKTRVPYDRFRAYKIAARLRKSAGLPDVLQLRDLRRTGATEMAEAGCTEDELRSVTGHKGRGVLNTYVRPTRKLAAGGINKRFG